MSHKQPLTKLIHRLTHHHPPLHPLIHSPPLITHSLLFPKTNHGLSQLITPKLHPAFNLHHPTNSLQFHFFTVFSSLVSIPPN
ncbi:KR domain-containing protein, partial [Bacillus velezensis]|uniref:KR domain-containing protein n=1 Tax=Bacillus velezensis TaxID=492670 RepID=UPI0037BF01C5